MSRLYFDGDAELLFTENESNPEALGLGGAGYFKDGFHERIVGGRHERVNPANTGTKAGVWYPVDIPPGGMRGVSTAARRAARPGRALRGFRRHV